MNARRRVAGRAMRARRAQGVCATALAMGLSCAAHAQIWSTDRTEEAARARALEEVRRADAARAASAPRTVAPPSTPSTPAAPSRPDTAADAAPAPTPTAPNTSFTAPRAASSPARQAPAQAVPRDTGQGLSSRIEPRDFGLTLGDVITQRVALAPATPPFADARLDLRAGRLGTWVERRSARREHDGDGREWLVIEHQLTNVANVIRRAEIPAQWVTLQGGGSLTVAPVAIDIAPLANVGGRNVKDARAALRDDRPPPLADVGEAWRRLRAALLALGATLGAWLLWWRWRAWRDARAQPFARALRELRDARDADAAWLAMHRALNAAAGRSVQAGTLDDFLARRPAYASEREALQRFFAVSSARFFANADSPPALDLPAFDLPALAHRLRRIEWQGNGALR